MEQANVIISTHTQLSAITKTGDVQGILLEKQPSYLTTAREMAQHLSSLNRQ